MSNESIKNSNEGMNTSAPLSLTQIGDQNTQIAHVDTFNYTVQYPYPYGKCFDEELDNNLDEIFVKTNIYLQVKKALEDKSIVTLVAQPGMGKTITSKVIANEYKKKGYRILYSEVGNISNAKGILKDIEPQNRTLIILNDFLGQYYTAFMMQQVHDMTDVGSLITLVKRNRNIKLIINTRSIIYQEALQHEKFKSYIENNTDVICEIRISDLSFEERSLILHKHMKRAGINGFLSEEHYFAILKDNAYLKIVLDEGFIPRIVEYVTFKSFLENIQPYDYVEQVFNVLRNPSDIWKKEYECLAVTDRICLNTLFSLTDTNVPVGLLKLCFDERINAITNIDTTVIQFDNSINRLLKSLLSIVTIGGEQRVGVINPSVNDFLMNYLTTNTSEIDNIIRYALFYEQVERLAPYSRNREILIERINTGLFGKLNTFPKQIFSNMEMTFAPPHYLYVLKILLMHLDGFELADCNIQKADIQDFILKIFESQYESIEANSRLYFAYEFSLLFCELLKTKNGYDLTGIMTNEKYADVVLNSIIRSNEFWIIIKDIKQRYFASEEMFFNHAGVKLCLIERIKSEIISDVFDTINASISSEIKDNWDELEDYDDYDDITDYVLQGIDCDINAEFSDAIHVKLTELKIDAISENDFDIDTIISDEINIIDMIEHEYDKLMYYQSDDFNENVKGAVERIIALFNDVSWFTKQT